MAAIATVEQSPERARDLGFEWAANAAGQFTRLLGSVGGDQARQSARAPDGIGRHGASPAQAKRTRSPVESSMNAVLPTQMAVAELSSRGTRKETVQAAERESRSPGEQGPARGWNRPAGNEPGVATRSGGPVDQSSGGSGPSRSGETSAATKQAPDPGQGSVEPATTGREAKQAMSLLLARPVPAAGASIVNRINQAIPSLARAQTAPQGAGLRAVIAPRNVVRSEGKGPQATQRPQRPDDAEAEFSTQLGRGFAAVLRQNGGSLTMRLQPEALGELTIRMQLQPGRVAATFEVESEQAQQLLHKNMSALRSALEARGLGVDSLAIHVSGKAAPEAPVPTELGTDHGGAGTPDGGATGQGGGGAGTDRPLAHAERERTRSDESTWPEAGAVGVETGGAQVIRLVLDATA